jgi:hypothetical protein
VARTKLSQSDRHNINVLANIYDAWVTGTPQRGPNDSITFLKDQDQLIKYGWVYGMSGSSMFGEDNQGRLWQCGLVDSHASKGGRWKDTVWYLIDEKGLRHKQEPLKWRDFNKLFRVR